MTLVIKGKEYKVKYGFNSFVDTDLMERTEALMRIFDEEANKDDKYGMARIKDLFTCVRELLWVGFKKHNPIDTLEEVGELLDDYMDEGTAENPHDLLELFGSVADELMNEGFLKGIMDKVAEEANSTKHPKVQK